MRVRVKSRTRVYDGYFKLDAAVLQFRQHDGQWSPVIERLVFERGDSAAVLLYDPHDDRVVLVEQFRYPAFLRDAEHGWVLEVVAGTVETGRDPKEVAISEAWEEAGYRLQQVDHLTTMLASPGACTERIHLFLGIVGPGSREGAGGGQMDHGEDVRIVEMSLEDALSAIDQGRIVDGKTIVALQLLARRQAARSR